MKKNTLDKYLLYYRFIDYRTYKDVYEKYYDKLSIGQIKLLIMVDYMLSETKNTSENEIDHTNVPINVIEDILDDYRVSFIYGPNLLTIELDEQFVGVINTISDDNLIYVLDIKNRRYL